MLIKEKVEQAVNILNALGLDCWITFVRETALNGDPILPFLVDGALTWHSAFIVSATGRKIAIVGKYDKRSVEDLDVYDQVIDFVEGFKKPFLEVMRTLNPRTIAVNFSKDSEICDGITHGMYVTLAGFLSEVGMQDRLVSAESVVSSLRQRKSPYEIRQITKAVRAAERIFVEVAGFIKPGRTEAEVASFMKKKVEDLGLELAWDEKTCPSVFTGPDTAGAHYNPTKRVVKRGHILNIDFGVKVGGYCSDLQRTFYILRKGEKKAPADVQKGFDTIVTSIEESKNAIRIGAKGVDIDNIARKIIVSESYAEFPHGLGHQVGRFAHDGTALLGPAWEKYGGKPFVPIEENMVFTIEPRLTVPERGIATIEEMVIVRKTGAEFLSRPQKKLILIR
ncbi:MAG TPA: Xaa-Pro peptidase family protein [Bacteroidota bacterium]